MFNFSLIFYLLISISRLESLNDFQQSGCGHSKSCLRWSSCNFPNCDYAFSWKTITFNSSDYLEIELVGKLTTPGNGYLALGFSLENKMIDNSVVNCHLENGALGISFGYNLNHRNYVLEDKDADENYLVRFEEPTYGIEFDSAANILRCRFLRLMNSSMSGDKLKDLSDGQMFYLLSAKGSYQKNTLKYHFTNKKPSIYSYNLASTKWIDNIITNYYVLVKLHACFMIFGWVFCSTNGIILANFYKENWPQTNLWGEKLWFQIHRLVQSISVLSVSTAFIIIFVHVGGYSSLGTLPNTAHPIMGIVATCFLLANPIMAVFRCHPKNPSRWIFNRMHFLVGITGYVLAICTMVIGIQLPPAGPNLANINYPWILVIVFLCLMVILFIYGELRNKLKANTSINEALYTVAGTSSKDDDTEMRTQRTGLHVIILSIIISFGFGITFLVLVIVH